MGIFTNDISFAESATDSTLFPSIIQALYMFLQLGIIFQDTSCWPTQQQCSSMWTSEHDWACRRRHPRKRGVSDKEQPLSDLIGAPLVLFMASEAIAGLALEKKQLDPWALQVWVQQPNALDEALLRALRCPLPISPNTSLREREKLKRTGRRSCCSPL